MKYIIAIIALLTISSAALAYPDLVVHDLEYSPSTGRLVATIYNQMPDPVTQDIVVYFYDNDNYYGAYTYTNGLPRYSTVSVYLNYDLDTNNHTIKAVVDPDNTIYESKEVNNEKTIFIEGHKIDMTPVSLTTSGVAEVLSSSAMSVLYYVIVIVILAVLIFVYVKLLRKKKMPKEKRATKEKKKDVGKTFFDE